MEPIKSLRIEYKRRSGGNKTMYVLYRAVKFLYVSLWFYFAPFIAIGLQFWLIDAQLEAENIETENLLREEYMNYLDDDSLM